MAVLVTVFVLSYAVVNLPFYGNTLPPYDSSRNPINIDFKFGVTERNELNTFQGTFTKDLCIDGTVTTRLILSHEELRQIQQKLVETDFFNLPEAFPINEQAPVPGYSCYLMVQNETTVKTVAWGSHSVIDAAMESKLDQLANFIANMILEKPECTRLPPPNGAYL